MKKEYVKPQNLVVELKDGLMQGAQISQGPGTDDPAAKDYKFEDFDSGDSPKNLWDD